MRAIRLITTAATSAALLLTAAGCGGQSTTPEASGSEQISFTDVRGDTVTLPRPAKTASVVYSGFGGPFLTMFALFGEDVDEHLASWDDGLKTRADLYPHFLDVDPGLDDVPVVTGSGSDLNAEGIIAAKPDIYLIPELAYEGAPEEVQRIKDAGIPVATIDFHSSELDKSLLSIEIIAKVFGADARGKELTDFYREQVEPVYERAQAAAAAEADRPKVYVELARDPAEYGNSYDKLLWGGILESLGARNIATDKGVEMAPLDREYVLSQKPDVVLLVSGGGSLDGSTMKLGYDITPEVARASAKPYVERPGWEAFPAVQNHRVYLLSHSNVREVWDFYAIQSVAKDLYPEEFADLDPDKTWQEFHSRFLTVAPQGVWALDYFA
ncbi:ABC transporter substrate-binding protein [Nocardioides sp.]|uniref:ABC transporter substrate-binding protein n=1 Tax=Nocardioides sp. TaxID=35761 RepID=UPI0039E27CF1